MNKEALLQKICASDKLPVLPDTAMKVIELGNDPDLYPEKVHNVIALDPVLSARLLQISNSAMFAAKAPVTNLSGAITLLGVQTTMSIAMGFAVVNGLREQEAEQSDFSYDTFWRKSVLGAVAAIEMRKVLDSERQGDLFVATLLQDIGMLALHNIVGSKYSQIVTSSRSHHDLLELERRVFNLDHAEVSTAILKNWNLPDLLCDAVSCSHHFFDAKSTNEMSNLEYAVAMSGMLAEQWIAETERPEELDIIIQNSLERLGQEGLKDLVSDSIKAIPSASKMFGVKLLSVEQLANFG